MNPLTMNVLQDTTITDVLTITLLILSCVYILELFFTNLRYLCTATPSIDIIYAAMADKQGITITTTLFSPPNIHPGDYTRIWLSNIKERILSNQPNVQQSFHGQQLKPATIDTAFYYWLLQCLDTHIKERYLREHPITD